MRRLLGSARRFLCVAAACAATLAFASTPEVDRGIAWLQAQPQANGTLAGEAASIATAHQARVETTVTLKQLATAPAAVADLIAQEPETTTEYTARTITALAPLGRDVTASVATLLSFQNADGGFGGALGYQSDALDTAYALLALKAASVTGAPVTSAVGYLVANQAADGSFAINDQPSVFLTAHALQALNAFALTSSVGAQQAIAKTWLVSQQAAGAYTSVLDNAVAALAITGATTDSSAFSGAQAALKAAQAADGSWGDDPYLTAIALRALVATGTAPAPATTGSISGVVVDTAGAAIGGALVQLSGTATATASATAAGAFLVNGLPPGAYTVQITQTGYATFIESVTVAAGVTTGLGTVRLPATSSTATLQGTISDGSTGQPLAGATVAVGTSASATTDAAGNYQVSGIAPGTVSVTVSKTGYQTVTATATLAAGTVLVFSPSLLPPGQTTTDTTVSGKVVDAATSTGISGATVQLGALTTTTTADGSFSFSGLSAGSISLQVSAAGYQTATVTATLVTGANNVGTIALPRLATTATISGHVTDSATAAAIGGATVTVQGTALAATTDSTGLYTLTGVTQTQFTLAIAAPGYQSATVAVNMPSLADATINATLAKAQTAGLVLTRVAPSQPAFDPFTVADIAADVQSTLAQATDVTFVSTVLDSAGNAVIQTAPTFVTIAAGATSTIPLEVHLTAQPAGTYSVAVRGFDSTSGNLLVEGSTGFIVNAVTKLVANIGLDPPIVQYGTGQPVNVTSAIFNGGNTPLPAGDLRVDITLTTPDTQILPKVTTTSAKIIDGLLTGSLNSGVYDGAGNLFLLNSDNRVIKYSSGGNATVLPAPFPTGSYFGRSLAIDPSGVLYALNTSGNIVKYDTATGMSPGTILTGLTSPRAFERDASGNFYVAGLDSSHVGLQLFKLDSLGGSKQVIAGPGLATPRGILRASDGNLYVANFFGGGISRVDASGAVTPFVDGINGPGGIAQGPDGFFYIAASSLGTAQNVIVKVDPTGQSKTAWSAGGLLSGPGDLRFAANGDLFVMNAANSSIVRIPAGSTVPQAFASSVVNSPKGMAYDASGNLYVVGAGGAVVKLDTTDTVNAIGTFNVPSDVAVSAANTIYVSAAGVVMSRPLGAPAFTTYASGLNSPRQIAIDGSGVVYVAENGIDQVTAIPTALAPTPFVSSLLSDAADVRVTGTGDRYVLNHSYLALLPASAPPRILARFTSSTISLALDASGNVYVDDSSTLRKLDAGGNALRTPTTIPVPVPGIAIGAAGDVLFATSSGDIRQVDATGALVTALYGSLGAVTRAITGDGSGGVYALMTSGQVLFVSGKGVAPRLVGALTGGGQRIALDKIGGEVYITTTTGLFAMSTSTGAVRHVTSDRTTLAPVDFANGTAFAIDTATRELLAYSPAGVQQGAGIAGFKNPAGLAWNGSELVITDTQRVLVVPAGGYPQVLINQAIGEHIFVSQGFVYGTLVNSGKVVRVSLDPSLTPAQRTAEVVYTMAGTGTSTLSGLAQRADGAVAIASPSDNRIEVVDLASGSLVASYAGLVSPTGIVLDASGNVYVSSSAGAQKIVKIDPTGKRSTLFSPVSAGALAFDAAGNLYTSEAGAVIFRYGTDGSKTLVGRSSDPSVTNSQFMAGIALSSTGDVFVTDSSPGLVRKLAATGNLFEPFASGLSDPRAIRVGADGSVYVANSSTSNVVRITNGQFTLVGSGFSSVNDIAVASSGRIYVSSNIGDLAVFDTTGLLVSLPSAVEQGGNSTAQSLAMGRGDTVAVFAGQKVFQDSYAYAPATPPAGTIVQTLTGTMSSVAVGSTSASVNFGSWIPPFAGEYSFVLHPLAPGVLGTGNNALHAGPGATGTITTAQSSLPPGDSTVGVNIRLTGADFTSVAKVDPSDVQLEAPASTQTVGFGADAQGNVYFTRVEPDPDPTIFKSYDVVRRAVPGGASQVVYRDPNPGRNSGLLPVDLSGNLYMASGVSNTNVLVVPLSHPADAAIYKGFTERIVGLAIDASDQILVLTAAHLYRIRRDATNTVDTLQTYDTSTGTTTFAVTTDGRGNIYVQLAFPPIGSRRSTITKYAPDGSSTIVSHLDEFPQFELEGVNMAGDCADNLFMAPFSWPLVGQGEGAEESTIVQVNGRTNSVAQILDGRNINADLTDIDNMVYDRFGQRLLLWTDRNQGNIYSVPAKCGTISADVHVVFPSNQAASGFSATPKAVITRTDGSHEYVWNVNDVSTVGSQVALATTLPGLQTGQVRAIASEAYLTFQNPFVAGELRQDLSIPVVTVDGMVDAAAATDLQSYPPEADVHGIVTLTNRDAFVGRGGNLDVRVLDAQGALVAVLVQQPMTLAAGASVTITPPFNTGTILAGGYQLVATLTDPQTGVVTSTSTAPFDIVTAGLQLITSVSTDKQSYQAVDTVTIDGRVKNVSLNSITGNLTVSLVVRDPAGNVLLQDSRAISPLVPGALRDTFFTLPLNAAPVGTYSVELTTTGGADGVDVRTTSFAVLSTVDTGSGLRGSTTATPLANQGSPVTMSATLTNQGNAALTGLAVTFKVVNPQTGQLMTQLGATATIPQGGTQTVSQTWATTGVPAGTYIAAASSTFSGRDISLGQAAVVIGVIQPFSFAPKANAAVSTATQTNVIESDPITLAGIVAPASISIVNGEYRIGTGGWTGAAGFVNPGDVVTVRVTASVSYNTTTTATLTIAGFSAPFSVTTVNPDVTPDPFAFTTLTNQPLATLLTSNTVKITGIDIPVPISIAGGEYSVNGGPWTAVTGTVANNDFVSVRLTSAGTLGTTTFATLTVSNVSAAFTVTTTAIDDTPDPFAFTPQLDVPVSTLRTSNQVTITGVNVAVPIRVTGGQYSVNGGAYTTTAGTVSNGDKVTLQHTSSASFSTTVTTTVTVSGFSASFESTTQGEDKSPDPFSFAPLTDAAIATPVVSNQVTISGINTAVAISIAGGEYSVNGGAYTAGAGTVSSNDKVTVRQTSSSSFATTTTATLTVSDFSAPFAVTTKAKADLVTTPGFAGDERVLVLVSCKLNGADDADDDPACLAQRQSFLDSYLASLGVLHRIVTTTDDFKSELRSGRYDAYWVSGGAKKLLGTLAEEVREAAFGGETAVLDGVHDQRNLDLDEVVGALYRGKPTGATTVTLTGPVLPAGSFDLAGMRPIRVQLTTGLRQAVLNTGDPAIATNAYGYGSGLLFAFDLTGTLMAEPSSTLLHDVLDDALAAVTPVVPAAFTGGAYVPITIAIVNKEAVPVDLDVTATLPAGFTFVFSAPPATATGSTVLWHVSLPANGSQSLEWAVRAPQATGSYTIALAVNQVYGTSSVADGTASIPIQVNGLDTVLPAVIAQLQALQLATSDANARNLAVASLQAAQSSIAVANWEQAIGQLVGAIDKLNGVNAVSVAPFQRSIDGVIREVEARWWSALPACPATAPCATP